MLHKLATIAVAMTTFVWFHLTCCRHLNEADALSLLNVLLITLIASMMEVIPRSVPAELLCRRPRRPITTAWDVVLAATDPGIGLWANRK